MKKQIFLLAAIILVALLAHGCSNKEEKFEEHFNQGSTALQSAKNIQTKQEAIKHLSKAISIKPDHIEARMLRAKANSACFAPEAAIRDFDHVLSLNPSVAQAYYGRALCLISMQSTDKKAIKQDLEKTLELDPKNIKAKQLLRLLED